jgi:CDP-glucose 4,6-dehydratase
MSRDSVQRAFWKGRNVLVTGHTGFKGSWLTAWLLDLGAKVTGFSLAPAEPSLFTVLGLEDHCRHELGDLRDAKRLAEVVSSAAPEIVLHLAAQPIVLESYRDPIGTFATNVLGTANLLQQLRESSSLLACVVVTSDKCYENREWAWGYRESDALGGRDPYSASKGCQEIVTASFRESFFARGAVIASGRAGNVIGGGDWGANRLVPDLVRAFAGSRSAVVRNPDSVRPWQHVLDPLRGYLVLAQACAGKEGARHARGYNFGPRESDSAKVSDLADRLVQAWGDGASWTDARDPNAPHEAGLLRLDTSLAKKELDWTPRLSLASTVQATVTWYRAFHRKASGAELLELTQQQIAEFGSVV